MSGIPQSPSRRREYIVCIRCGQEGHRSNACPQPNPLDVPEPPPGLPKYQQDYLDKLEKSRTKTSSLVISKSERK